MHPLWSSPIPTNSRWIKRTVVLGLVFLLTVTAVYVVGTRLGRQSRSFSATAVISVPEPAFRSAFSPQQFVPDALIRKAITNGGSAADPPGPTVIANARRHLQVVSTGRETPGLVRVALSYTAATAEEALGVVNRLGRLLAERHHSAKAASSREARRDTQAAAAEEARLEWRRAESDLRQFVQQQFQQWRQRTVELKNAVEGPSAAELAAPPAPETDEIENPAWVELNNQVTELKEKRAELLASRTALHPAVKDLDTDLARLEGILAGIPPHIAGPSESAREAPAARSDRGPDFADAAQLALEQIRGLVRFNAAAAEAFAAKTAAVDEARRKYEQLTAAERRAREEDFRVPWPTLQLADQSRVIAGPSSGRLPLVALAAGLAMTVGVGLTWRGAAADLTLSRATDVEAALAVPVVGTVSLNEPFHGSVRSSPIPGVGSVLMVIFGITLMVACLGLLVLAACVGIGF